MGLITLIIGIIIGLALAKYSLQDLRGFIIGANKGSHDHGNHHGHDGHEKAAPAPETTISTHLNTDNFATKSDIEKISKEILDLKNTYENNIDFTVAEKEFYDEQV